MIREVTENDELADQVQQKINQRQIIDCLMGLRSALDLSQEYIASKMKRTQSSISKLEKGEDDALRIGHLRGYAEAMGFGMTVVLYKDEASLAAQVKHYAFAIRGILTKMAKLAGDDQSIAMGVREFYQEAAANIGRFIDGAAHFLDSYTRDVSPLPKQPAPLIRVENSSN